MHCYLVQLYLSRMFLSWLSRCHDIVDSEVQADHLSRRMTNTDPLAFRARHDDQLGCDSTSPEYGYFAILDYGRITEFGVIDIGYA